MKVLTQETSFDASYDDEQGFEPASWLALIERLRETCVNLISSLDAR